ncbi:salivary glue protein Sgs-4-like [Salvelinus sp. IW2-2015]|uniref:salivary glue protein Sgs-4-like n=1 Tax=Salvelinus sp. IW2-2015 TaxID=2691554 RepID=UPI0038D4E43B
MWWKGPYLPEVSARPIQKTPCGRYMPQWQERGEKERADENTVGQPSEQRAQERVAMDETIDAIAYAEPPPTGTIPASCITTARATPVVAARAPSCRWRPRVCSPATRSSVPQSHQHQLLQAIGVGFCPPPQCKPDPPVCETPKRPPLDQLPPPSPLITDTTAASSGVPDHGNLNTCTSTAQKRKRKALLATCHATHCTTLSFSSERRHHLLCLLWGV